MRHYVFVYYGEPRFTNPEEGGSYRAKWKTWMDGLGDALVNPGVPIGEPKTVSSDNVSDGDKPNRVTGFSIVQADRIDVAVKMAQACPHLAHGTVDVAEAMEMRV